MSAATALEPPDTVYCPRIGGPDTTLRRPPDTTRRGSERHDIAPCGPPDTAHFRRPMSLPNDDISVSCLVCVWFVSCSNSTTSRLIGRVMNAPKRRPQASSQTANDTTGYEVVVICNTGTRRYPAGCIREARNVQRIMLAMWATAQPKARIIRCADHAVVQ